MSDQMLETAFYGLLVCHEYVQKIEL